MLYLPFREEKVYSPWLYAKDGENCDKFNLENKAGKLRA